MYFISKRGIFVSIFSYGILLFLWWQISYLAYHAIVSGKSSTISLAPIIFGFILGVLLTWMAVSCGYTVTGDYLIAKLGPIRQRIKLSDIEIVRWDYGFSDLGAMTTSRDALYIRSENDFLKVSPKDVSGFLKLLRERCPTAEITSIEIPPRFFSNNRPYDTISAKEQSLDEKEASNTLLLSITAVFPLLFLGFICLMLWFVKR